MIDMFHLGFCLARECDDSQMQFQNQSRISGPVVSDAVVAMERSN